MFALQVIGLIGPIKFHLFNALKVPITAILFRTFLKQILTNNQWYSILLLFVGLIVTQQSDIYGKVCVACLF